VCSFRRSRRCVRPDVLRLSGNYCQRVTPWANATAQNRTLTRLRAFWRRTRAAGARGRGKFSR
jgi:hypothetical protein